MVITTYKSTQYMINKLKSLRGKTKLKFYKENKNGYYDEVNYRRRSGNSQFGEDLFSENVQVVGIIYHEVLLLMKYLQTKLQAKNMNNKYYDLFCTVTNNRDDKENE